MVDVARNSGCFDWFMSLRDCHILWRILFGMESSVHLPPVSRPLGLPPSLMLSLPSRAAAASASAVCTTTAVTPIPLNE